MNKKKTRAFRKDVFLLGADSEETMYWLEDGSWDCDWYWGIGYVETYTNNKNPELARDIESHRHFDGLFFNGTKNGYDLFKEFFVETPLSDKEIWTLVELMKSLYILREYSDMLHCGGAHYTTNPNAELLNNETEYKRINEEVIPTLLKSVRELLTA